MKMNSQTLQTRRQCIIDQLPQGSVAVILSGNAPVRTGDEFHEFAVWRNFFYLTNISRANFALVMMKANSTVQTLLFIDEVSELEEKWTGYRMKKAEASELSQIPEKDIHSMGTLTKHLGGLLMSEGLTHGYFDFERLTYEHLDTHQITFAKQLKERYPFISLANLYPIITKLRQIKSSEEIENVRTAVEKTRLGIEAIMKNLRPGMFEYEIEAHYDFATKMNGVQEKAFQPIIATGANATVLHYDSRCAKAGDGDLVLLDLGCAWHHYSADISRTLPINGKFTPRQKAVYNAVLDVQKQVINKVAPGVTMEALGQEARKLLADKCRELGLITGNNDDDVAKYYYHGVAHALGLNTHDVGGRAFVLEAGMIVTIEPGLYIEAEGIGIRIEDDILVTATGCENLSASIIKEVAEIEALMNEA